MPDDELADTAGFVDDRCGLAPAGHLEGRQSSRPVRLSNETTRASGSPPTTAIIELVPGGRPVFAPAGLLHWHGASPDEHVVQLTILGGGDGGPTSWREPMSEEGYRGQ